MCCVLIHRLKFICTPKLFLWKVSFFTLIFTTSSVIELKYIYYIIILYIYVEVTVCLCAKKISTVLKMNQMVSQHNMYSINDVQMRLSWDAQSHMHSFSGISLV